MSGGARDVHTWRLHVWQPRCKCVKGNISLNINVIVDVIVDVTVSGVVLVMVNVTVTVTVNLVVAVHVNAYVNSAPLELSMQQNLSQHKTIFHHNVTQCCTASLSSSLTHTAQRGGNRTAGSAVSRGGHGCA